MSEQTELFHSSPFINENGVMDKNADIVTKQKVKTKQYQFSVWVAMFPDGFWYGAYDVSTNIEGASGPLQDVSPACTSERDALLLQYQYVSNWASRRLEQKDQANICGNIIRDVAKKMKELM